MQSEKMRYIRTLLLVVLISAAIEVFVFNFRTFETASLTEVPFSSNMKIDFIEGTVGPDGVMTADPSTGVLVVSINDIDTEIDNFALDIVAADEEGKEVSGSAVYVDSKIRDDAVFEMLDETGDDNHPVFKKGYRRGGSKTIVSSVPATKYFWVETFGKTSSIELTISEDLSGYSRFLLKDLKFNSYRPFSFSAVRFLLVFTIICSVWVFVAEPTISERIIDKKKYRYMIVIAVMTAISVFFFWWPAQNKLALQDPFSPYAELAKAFSQGRLYIDEAPDYVNQAAVNKAVFWNAYDAGYRLDYLLYNGKYYVYFGVLPCLLFYLPFYLITGKDLPNFSVIALLCLLLIFLTGYFFKKVRERWYQKAGLGSLLLYFLTVAAGMYIPFFIAVPEHYIIPIIAAVDLIIGGLIFWVKTYENDNIRYHYASISGFLFALVSLCRPDMLIYPAAVLLVTFICKRERLKGLSSKEKVNYAMAVFVPYVLIGAACMIYNYARFKNPFDFGAKYNLTSLPLNAITPSKGYMLFRSFFEYFLETPELQPAFPYVYYKGWQTLQESGILVAITKLSGGMFFYSPFLVFGGGAAFLYMRRFKEKKVAAYLIAGALVGLFLMFFSALYTGFITTRYTLEFSWVFMYIAGFGWLEAGSRAAEKGEETRHTFDRVANLVMIISIIIGSILFFVSANSKFSLAQGNPALWYRIVSIMDFWG